MNAAEEFLRQKDLFQLGDLPTETPHPRTVSLSEWSKLNLDRALSTMREIDLGVLHMVLARENELRPIFESVAATLTGGHRVYLVGCGATGRLSLSLEYLWRRRHPDSDQVRSLMAGGDVALVHSLEGFEDFPEYGARHLNQLGFGADDLLIGTTEGGETPYVIGAVEEAARRSSRQPLFIFCNPVEILQSRVERSARVFANPRIASFCLPTGPMALTGSTRMQASTALMLVVGLALEHGADTAAAFRQLRDWIDFLEKQSVSVIKPFIVREADAYQDGQYTCYTADDFAITVFTDTTERAPTFNLAPFDNPHELTNRHSLTYLAIPQARDAAEAWHKLLAHPPRPLNWAEVHPKATATYLSNFDFGPGAIAFRKRLVPAAEHFEFAITRRDRQMIWDFRELSAVMPLFGTSDLFDHLTLKMLLNMHSTLVMGRLSRFEGNLMTWVYPSNGKLVDRAARYTQILLRQIGRHDFTYEEIVRAQFASKVDLHPQESIVHKTIARLLSGRIRQPEFRGPR